jgi:hypothetical protein
MPAAWNSPAKSRIQRRTGSSITGVTASINSQSPSLPAAPRLSVRVRVTEFGGLTATPGSQSWSSYGTPATSSTWDGTKSLPRRPKKPFCSTAWNPTFNGTPTKTGCFVLAARPRGGCYITIIYTVRDDAVRVVTGYPMTKRQQRIYFQGR